MDEKQRNEFSNYLKYSAEKLIGTRAVPEILLKEIERKLHSYSEDFGTYKVKSVAELSIEIAEKQNAREGLKTNFKELDELSGGIPVSLIVLGARPGMGKTALLLSMAFNLGFSEKRVGFVSLEMGTEMVIKRFNQMKVKAPGSAWEYIDIIEPTDFSIQALIVAITDYYEKSSPSIIMIDYLQLITLGGYVHNREREISYIMSELKRLSKKLDVPIIVSSQLSRAVETRGGEKRPQLSDLRESGAIEQESDLVWFLYRPEYYGICENEDGDSTQGLAELIIAKNKFGPCDTISLAFIGVAALFRDIDHDGKSQSFPPGHLKEYDSFKEMYEEIQKKKELDSNSEEPPF